MGILYRRFIYMFILSVALFFQGISFAGERDKIDVVLLIDTSGSMKKTDPLSLRIPAAKMFISLLESSDRAGIVGFSDVGYPLSNLILLDSDRNRTELLETTAKISSSGLYTNLYDALDKGLSLLISHNEEKRTQIIILMSDGKMDVGDPDRDDTLVHDLKNNLLVQLRERDIRIYTIAFTDFSDKQLLKEIAEDTGGVFYLAPTHDDFHLIFTSIFENLKIPDMLPIDENSFYVDTSIEEVTVIATKDSPETHVSLQSPDGKKSHDHEKGDNISWFVSHSFDMITLKEPAPGRWKILFSKGKNNRAYIVTNLSLTTNMDNTSHPTGQELNINAWFEKDGTTLIEEEVLKKIHIYAEGSLPGGKIEKFVLYDGGENTDREKGDGVFSNRFMPKSHGKHSLRIIAKGATFHREKVYSLTVTDPEQSEKESLEQNKENVPEVSSFSLKAVIMNFFLINLIIGGIILIYFKRESLKPLLHSMRRRRAS